MRVQYSSDYFKSGLKKHKIQHLGKKHKKKKNKLCFSSISDCRDTRRSYWHKGFKNLWDKKYKCTVKRRTGKHVCDCRVTDYYLDCVVLEDCYGEKIIICFDDICSLEMGCGYDDWKKYLCLFD